jgi:voltage-gated potassium channel
MHFIHRLSVKLLRLKNSLLAYGTILFILISSAIVYYIEPDTFQNGFNALWWVMTTVATVGYGDFYPTTVAGKLFAMFLYVFGIGLLSLVIGKIIEAIADLQRRRGSGKLKFQGRNHIILLNWSKKSQLAVEEIMSTDENAEIVIISESDKHPYDRRNIHFVSGDPTSDDTLEQAGINRARSAIIFADPGIEDSSLVDGKSLLIAASIERIAPDVHTTVEITLEKHIQNFRHVKVNEFVLSHDAVSRLAVRSALNEGNIEILTQLLSRQHGEDVFEAARDPEWRTYSDAFQALLKEGATLVADGSDMTINRKLHEQLPVNTRLFVITDKATIDKINAKGRNR